MINIEFEWFDKMVYFFIKFWIFLKIKNFKIYCSKFDVSRLIKRQSRVHHVITTRRALSIFWLFVALVRFLLAFLSRPHAIWRADRSISFKPIRFLHFFLSNSIPSVQLRKSVSLTPAIARQVLASRRTRNFFSVRFLRLFTLSIGYCAEILAQRDVSRSNRSGDGGSHYTTSDSTL